MQANECGITKYVGIYWMSLLLIILLLFAFVGDMLQYAVRIIASVINQSNLSTHLVTLSMLVNRFGAALSLLLIGFMIDIGANALEFSQIYTIFTIVLGLFYWLKARYPVFGSMFLGPFITRYYNINVDTSGLDVKKPLKLNINLDVAIVFSIALLGFLLPSLLAAAFPDYRATLLQTGFILNSFATIYSALKIEKSLALTMNNSDNDEKWRAYCEFMNSRSAGCVLAAGTFCIIYIFLI